MKNILFAAVLVLVAHGAVAQAPGGSKFGFVHTERITRESVPAQRAQKRLEAEFLPREQELARLAEQLKRMQDDIDKNGMTMADAQRRLKEREFGELNRDFQRKQRELREDFGRRRQEELRQVFDQADRVIRQIAEQEKFDIIFQEMPAYVSPRIDITDKVIKALEGKPPAK